MALLQAFDDDTLSVLASEPSINRGLAYAAEARVTINSRSKTSVTATVKGIMAYQVSLSSDGGVRQWRCSCPVGLSGEFCKHAVAVTAVLSGRVEEASAESNSVSTILEKQQAADNEVRAYLQTLEPADMVELLFEIAQRDGRLHARLLREARLSQADAGQPDGSTSQDDGSVLDIKALKKEVTAAYGRGFVSYREAADWAADVNDAIDWISDICDAGHFEAAALLAEHAHKRTETAVQRVDDSDGWITDIFHRIADIHATACTAGAFSPKNLAHRLVKLELNAELDTFQRSAVSHAEALGTEGLELYGQLVNEAFDALPADSSPWGAMFRVHQARIGHAIASGDPDLLVDVMSDDIRSPYDHVEIIDAYDTAGYATEALAWADRSLQEFADRTHQLHEVRARRADLLRRIGDDDAVVAMYRESFEATPTPETYRLYVDNAGAAEEAREIAIAFVMGRLSDAPTPDADEPSGLIGRPVSDRRASNAVSVLLAASDHERAWAVALAHGATQHEWHKMAEQRQLEDPESAITVFAAEAEAAIGRKNRSGYQTAANLLARIERLAAAVERPELSSGIVDDIKGRHRRKTSLMKLLG